MSGFPLALQGKLLVARPSLLDPNFARSVVLVLAHGEQGALGIVLNRPTATRVGLPLPDWDALATAPEVVFCGGPVPQGTICLARVRSDVSVPASGYLPLQGPLGTVDLEAGPSFVGPWVRDLRIFAGYAGWQAGQLESEMAEDAWWVLEASAADPFSEDPGSLWKQVLRRQGGELAIVSALPSDPQLN